jgi:ribosomal protein L11 methyltransferase
MRKGSEYLPRAVWKSHEQDGDGTVNKFTSGSIGPHATRACELRVNFCEIQRIAMSFKPPSAMAVTQLATLETGELAARRVADLFAESFAADEVAVSLVDSGQDPSGQRLWRVAIYFAIPPDEAAMRELAAAAGGDSAGEALRFETIAAKDWVGESLAALKPVTAGRFVIHGAHDRDGVPPNHIGIEIDAALAFGTGHHGTTRGCLLAVDHICKRARVPRRILDVGTGTGILSIAVVRAWRQSVTATDIDLGSVRVARDNARLNRAGDRVTFLHTDGISAPAIRARAPFELIFANILLGPLKHLAAPLRSVLAPGGRIILSGILHSQANAALAAYRPLTLERRFELEGWTTLVLRRKLQSGTRRIIAPRRLYP